MAAIPRITQLDSLRGLAAATVVLGHMLLFWPGLSDQLLKGVDGGYGWLLFPIPYIFIAAHPAVILFFVLSGFVLALPVAAHRTVSYPVYVWRRICRIWIPYVVCVAGAMLAASLLFRTDTRGLSTWAQNQWTRSPTLTDIVQHGLLIGTMDTYAFDGAIWSLVHEMRISLIFPLLAAMVMRCNLWQTGLVLICLLIPDIIDPAPNWRDWTLREYPTTFFYSGMFLVGAVLAKHHIALQRWSAGLNSGQRLIWLIVGAVLYTADCWDHALKTTAWQKPADLVITAGASVFLILALSSVKLTHWFPLWLGKISYSLYLWHLPVLMTVVRIGLDRAPLPVLVLAGGILSLAVAALSQRFIEAPSIVLARRFGGPAKPKMSTIAENIAVPANDTSDR